MGGGVGGLVGGAGVVGGIGGIGIEIGGAGGGETPEPFHTGGPGTL